MCQYLLQLFSPSLHIFFFHFVLWLWLWLDCMLKMWNFINIKKLKKFTLNSIVWLFAVRLFFFTVLCSFSCFAQRFCFKILFLCCHFSMVFLYLCNSQQRLWYLVWDICHGNGSSLLLCYIFWTFLINRLWKLFVFELVDMFQSLWIGNWAELKFKKKIFIEKLQKKLIV